MANSIFNPAQFFTDTTHYASRGRGLFTIHGAPTIFSDAKYKEPFGRLGKGFMASSITIPGQQLGLYEAFSYSGPTRRQAHTQIFGDLEIEFLLMGNTPEQAREIYLLMTEWHEKIAGPHVEGSQTQSLIPSIPTIDTDAFNVEYYDNYVTNASIDIYSPMVSASTSKPIVILHNTYYGLFPVNVGALTTSWESPDAPMTLPVTFTYYYVRSTIPAQ